MTKDELNGHFQISVKTPADFIRWASALNYEVSPATISRHRAGTQGITIPWAIAYTCFFSSFNGS